MARIPRFKKQNVGSIIKIEYAPTFAFIRFIPTSITTIKSTGIDFRPGYGWEAINCSQDTMGHQQDMSANDNGESWAHQVVGYIPGDEQAIEDPLADMSRLRYVVRITQANGTVKIVGSPRYPLDFDLKSATSNTYAGQLGTSLVFAATSAGRALIYQA
ncbi:hypothetical protein KHS38_12060 [Mucilaginibacter sp. Bleaf8]|uniref:hypothetical protein n=1 Tax=Mucilaginibacter sp. Bleaf8 TaxID=2834430 RepID=UPI001BD06D78|nr:hypothetical protein [Mucilaginibacter sp. Bleaf8]MBS7565139.1 hypothetical protein [Mucilaginibacter sp. Bleaf8]